jgi:hypothetical protein
MTSGTESFGPIININVSRGADNAPLCGQLIPLPGVLHHPVTCLGHNGTHKALAAIHLIRVPVDALNPGVTVWCDKYILFLGRPSLG